jgi:hypothetical protein
VKEQVTQMETLHKRKFLFFILPLFLAIVFMLPTSAMASENKVEGTVGKGEILDQSLILFAPEVVMDGVINGDLLAIGNDVSINGKVSGSLFVIGKNVTINGPVEGTVYAAALKLNMDSKATIGRDVYFIGASLVTQEKSTINRDLHAVSLEAGLSGTVGGNVDALIGPVNIINVIYNFALEKGWLSQPLKFNLPWLSRGYLSQPVPVIAFGLSSINNHTITAALSETALNAGQILQTSAQSSTIDVERLKSWVVPLLRNLAALLILGFLVLWLAPTQLSWAGEQARTSPWRMLLTGLLVFVIGWFAALLALVVILGLAIFLYWVSLPGLGFLVGALGMMALGLALIVFWLSIAYFSKIIIAFLFGKLLFKRFLPKYADNRILPFLTGVIIYALVASIPYLGWLVVVIVTFYGLGALWKLSSMRKLPEVESTALPQPVGDEPETSVIVEE